MKNRLYDIQSRPLDFKLRIESSSNEYEDIKYALQDIKKALEYFSDTKYNENKNRRQDLISINSIDFSICYIMYTIIKAIKEDNIAELTVIHYMISLMEFEKYNTHTRFTKYFNKIIKAFLRITRKNNTKDFNEDYWYKILEKHYYKSLYYLYSNAYKCHYFNTWIKELNHLLYY